MSRLSPEIIAQIRGIEIRAGHIVNDVLSGEYTSAFRGRGMEFDEVREYVPGDDIRTIDWNVTARMQVPFVKVYREEREMTLMLLVDVSASMAFGTTTRDKRQVAAEIAAILAFLAVRNQDKVGLILFSDHIEEFIPPKKGRGHIWHIIRSVLTERPHAGKTDVAGAFDFLGRVQKRRALVFTISDFIAADFSKSLKRAAARHDLVGMSILDPMESAIRDGGLVAFHDAEAGIVQTVDTRSAVVRAAFAARAGQRLSDLAKQFSASGAELLKIDAQESVVKPLAAFMRRREGRRRG